MYHVAYRNGREGAAVGLARARVDCCRASRALASAKDVAANYKESVCIDSLAWSDEFVPPAGLLVIFGVPAGGVRIGGQRRTNPHGVIAGGVQCAVRFVTDGQGRERLAAFQQKALFTIILVEILGDYGTKRFMQIFTHMHKR